MATQTISAQFPHIVADKFTDENKTGLAWLTENGNPRKLKLGLRTLAIDEEFRSMHLPRGAKDLMEMALQKRNQMMGDRYDLVFIWIRMQSNMGEFWKQFGCSSVDELLARLDLPDGRTLANWEILARLFDKETFLLVGDKVLGYMTLQIGQYQLDINRRKKDYQVIFETYCRDHSAFDKMSFFELVNMYVNKHYVKNLRPEDWHKRPRKYKPGESGHRRAAYHTAVDEETGRGSTVKDFKIGVQQCPGCTDRNKLIEAAKVHIGQLREIIRRGLGPKEIPPLPDILTEAFK